MREVIPVPALQDNYAYLICDRARRSAVVVDPSDAAPVMRALEFEGLRISAIWCTHHHPDHVGGIEGLLHRFGELPVIGSAYDAERKRIPSLTSGVREGDVLQWDGEPFSVWEVPGHTLGAVAFVGRDSVFTGDTLFLAGCGRLFEGSAATMRRSLSRFRTLPEDMRVYVGHEYTEANLRFAAAVEPDSSAIAERTQRVRELRTRGVPTVPGSIEEELATNPFMRWDAPSVRKSNEEDDEVFARLRREKDAFR